MTEQLWTDVDQYLCERLSISDGILDAALQANASAELPAIDVSPLQGKFLQLLAQSIGANRILEIGTLGGYSTIWMARGLPQEGKLVTLELESHHANVARSNIDQAGLSSVVEVRQGDALESLQALLQAKVPPFDLTFIDADKERCADYFDLAVQLARAGSLILVDNVIRDGELLNESSDDSRVQGVQRLFAAIAKDNRVSVTTLQTVGAKGYDGFVMAIVNDGD